MEDKKSLKVNETGEGLKADATKVPPVEYIVYEGAMARNERHVKRLWIALIVLIVTLLLCNGAWLLYFSQYDFANYDYQISTADGGDVDHVAIGNEGDVYNGVSPSDEENTNAQKP